MVPIISISQRFVDWDPIKHWCLLMASVVIKQHSLQCLVQEVVEMGTDLSALPYCAIDRVEILRDGASAQYGSDAIAGVINLVLKKTTGVFTGNVGFGTYYDQKYNPESKEGYQQYVHDDAHLMETRFRLTETMVSK